jgi:enoyl-CoA hydratase/carnithine racemase
MDDATILLSREGTIARVRLNRPEARNAVNLAMCESLLRVFTALDDDPEIHVVLLDAAGPAFCAGADLKERTGKDERWVRRRRLAAFAAYDAIERCSKPVVAKVHGAVVGSGGEIAMACDFIVASTDAAFRFPEPQWGTVGATQRLQRVIGKRRAKELLFTGRAMPSQEALGLGLVARLAEPAEIESAVQAVAAEIAKAPPIAIALTKRAVDLGEEVSLSTGIRVELAHIESALAGAEWRKGIEKFAENVGTRGRGEGEEA